MTLTPWRLALVLAALTTGLARGADGQTAACQPAVPPAAAASMFTAAQEADLGDAIAESVARTFRVIDDPDLTARLKAIGDRLVAQLPPSALRFRFFLLDLPEANAFVLPGGRVYVSRKMVAFARSEDELAGVISHEIGHLVARQQAIRLTRQFREVLGVTSVGDRESIFDAYNRLIDNLARHPKALARIDVNEHQLEADRLGMVVAAAAGFDPQGSLRLYERLTETDEDDGNFLLDLFGRTRPSVKRVREMIGTQAGLPAECLVVRVERAPDDFSRWQSRVIAASRTGRAEVLGRVVARTQLEPPLRGDLTSVRFSPDGRLILAHDAAGITVLTRDPFQLLFRIDAPDAVRPQFSPDSTAIAFHTTDLRVEVWNLARRSLERAHELVVRESCRQTALSPGARVMACLTTDFGLVLYDVRTGTRLLEKGGFVEPRVVNPIATLAFSPDGRFFVAGYHEEGEFTSGLSDVNASLVFDVQSGDTVSVRGTVRRLIAAGFAFVGPDRLLVMNGDEPRRSAIVRLPDGDTVETASLVRGRLEAATKGPYVFVRPFQRFATAVLDLNSGRVTTVSPYGALDISGDVIVSERASGELALYEVDGRVPLGIVTLPRDALERLRGVAISPDLHWLALSGVSRGGIWNTDTGERAMPTPAFSGGVMSADGTLLARVAAGNGPATQMARLETASGLTTPVGDVRDRFSTQAGRWLVAVQPARVVRGERLPARVQVREAATLETRWTQTFDDDGPTVRADVNGAAVFLSWAAASRTVRARLDGDPALLQQLARLEDPKGDYYIEIVDPETGRLRGRLFIETGEGSFRMRSMMLGGDWVAIADTANRVRVYSLETGDLVGRVFGRALVVSPQSGLVVVENGPGRVLAYDMRTATPREEFVFDSAVAAAAFDPVTARLLVVTQAQSVVVVEIGTGRSGTDTEQR